MGEGLKINLTRAPYTLEPFLHSSQIWNLQIQNFFTKKIKNQTNKFSTITHIWITPRSASIPNNPKSHHSQYLFQHKFPTDFEHTAKISDYFPPPTPREFHVQYVIYETFKKHTKHKHKTA